MKILQFEPEPNGQLFREQRQCRGWFPNRAAAGAFVLRSSVRLRVKEKHDENAQHAFVAREEKRTAHGGLPPLMHPLLCTPSHVPPTPVECVRPSTQ